MVVVRIVLIVVVVLIVLIVAQYLVVRTTRGWQRKLSDQRSHQRSLEFIRPRLHYRLLTLCPLALGRAT